MIRYLNFLIILLILSVPCLAQDTTSFAWDYSAEDQAAIGTDGGFHIYRGDKSNTYTDVVGTATPMDRSLDTNTATLCGDQFFAATAFTMDNGTELESGYSNEVTAAYPPKPATGLAFTDPGQFTWSLSPSNCAVLQYHVYLSKTSGAYSFADIVATTSAGNITVDLAAYRGRWYAVVVPFTNGNDGREILGDFSNELSLVFRPNSPTRLRIP